MKKKIPFLVAFVMVLSIAMTFFLMGKCDLSSKEYTDEDAIRTTADTTVISPYEKAMDDYNDIIASLSKGSAYAFADMAEDQDALLVAENPIEFDGKVEAAKATVYAKDKDGNVKKMGTVESTTTSLPLVAYDHAVYFGSHHSMSKASIDTEHSKMDIETAKSNGDETDTTNKAYNLLFDDYGEGTVIEFTILK